MDLPTIQAIAQTGAVGIALVLIYFGYQERRENRKSMESISERDNAFQKSAYAAINGNNEALRNVASRTGDIEKILERQTFIIDNHSKHVETALMQSAQTQENLRTVLETFMLLSKKNGNGNGKQT